MPTEASFNGQDKGFLNPRSEFNPLRFHHKPLRGNHALAINLRIEQRMTNREIALALGISREVAGRFVKDYPLTDAERAAAMVANRWVGVIKKGKDIKLVREARKRHYARHREKYRAKAAEKRRGDAPYLLHGITKAQFEEMLARQDGVCAFCGLPPAEGKRLVIDHDHECCKGNDGSCGKCIRGLIHDRCNLNLGIIEKALRSDFSRKYLAACGMAAETRI